MSMGEKSTREIFSISQVFFFISRVTDFITRETNPGILRNGIHLSRDFCRSSHVMVFVSHVTGFISPEMGFITREIFLITWEMEKISREISGKISVPDGIFFFSGWNTAVAPSIFPVRNPFRSFGRSRTKRQTYHTCYHRCQEIQNKQDITVFRCAVRQEYGKPVLRIGRIFPCFHVHSKSNTPRWLHQDIAKRIPFHGYFAALIEFPPL